MRSQKSFNSCALVKILVGNWKSYTHKNAAYRANLSQYKSRNGVKLRRAGKPALLYHISQPYLVKVIIPAMVLLFSGCFPSSCRHRTSRALLPSDSLSRQIASSIPEETLELVWSTSGTDRVELQYPRTIQFGEDNVLYVADTRQNVVFVLDSTGSVIREVGRDRFHYPYLAGHSGDTVLVFNPESERLDYVLGDQIVRRITLPGKSDDDVLRWVRGTDRGIYLKSAGTREGSHLIHLDTHGNVIRQDSLVGPHWRHAGLLRQWGDSLISLSGYRPVLDILNPDGELDTLILKGFDSPMLERSRAFIMGLASQPPLLSPSSTPVGAFLFVLNLRPGWLRIDAYDHHGNLQHVLVEYNPRVNRQYYPVDLAVRQESDSSFTFAVAIIKPEPRVALYRWKSDSIGSKVLN